VVLKVLRGYCGEKIKRGRKMYAITSLKKEIAKYQKLQDALRAEGVFNVRINAKLMAYKHALQLITGKEG